MDNLRIIAIKLKEHRKMKNITQQELADKTECSRYFITQLESNNAKNVTLSKIEEVFKYLGVQIAFSFYPLEK